MSNIISNLRVVFGADTREFRKGMDEGEKAIKKLGDQGKSAFSELASVFGINVNQISQQSQAFTGSLKVMGTTFQSTAKSSGILTAALKVLKIAIAATGIGLLVVALGSVVSYFTKTKEGADAVERGLAGIRAAISVLVDRMSEFGRVIVKAFEDPKATIASLWEFLKSQFINRIAGIPRLIEAAWKLVKGIITGGAGDAAKEFQAAFLQLTTGLDDVQREKISNYAKGVVAEVKKETKEAAELTRQLQQLRDMEIKLIETKAERERQIAEFRLISKDETKDIMERMSAAKAALNLEKQILNEESYIATERARIIEAQKELGNNLAEDDRELAEAKAKVNEVQKQSIDFQRRLQAEMQSLTKEYDRQLEAAKKLYAEKGKLMQGSLSPVMSAPVLDIKLPDLKPAVSIWEDYAAEVKSVVMDLGAVLNDALVGVTVGFAETFGQLLAGTADLESFSNVVLSSLADLAITVGKIAISTGVAVLGIKKALMSLNPVAAIAAGVALVALGTWAKSSLKSAASGGGSLPSGGSSGPSVIDARGSQFSQLEQKPVLIRIEGEFRQRGAEMVATINETNYRKNLRT